MLGLFDERLDNTYNYNSFWFSWQMKNKKTVEKSKDKILNEIPIFLAKTYRIVDNPSYSDTIQWIPQGNGFVVKNVSDLTQNIFAKHFKHTNYASFVRQLNLYGFHKVRSSDEGHIFTHNYFRREEPQLLPLIKRKNAPQAEPAEKNSARNEELVLRNKESQMMLPYDPSRDQHYEKELSVLTEKHEGLQNLVSVLVQQNKEIIMQNKSFIGKLNKMDESYRKKLETLIFLMVFGLKNGENNIIVPQQLSNMIKAFTSKGKKKGGAKKNPQPSESQALEIFKKPGQGRFYNKGIEQILQMLKIESEGEGQQSQEEEQQHHEEQSHLNSNLQLGNDNSIVLNEDDDPHGLTPQHTPLLSPMPSLHSFPSRYAHDKIDDEWDFLGKLDQSEMDLQQHKQ